MTITEQTAPALDPQVNERLQRLNQRRASSTSQAAINPPQPSKKRRHPARKTRIAALALSLASTAALTGGFAATDSPTSSIAVSAGGIVSAETASQTVAGPTTVNGDVFVNKWGPVQVQATFGTGGELVAVDAVQVPFADGKSVRINDRAVPTLNNEAISAQSAQVDTVSGATYTSVDYEQSLQSAIDAARAGGITQLL